VEKEQFASEKIENDNRLAATQQKIAVAMQLSIDKVKSLQEKLLEAKQQNELLTQELAKVRLNNVE
jgi:glutamate mutase epsilon subunit